MRHRDSFLLGPARFVCYRIRMQFPLGPPRLALGWFPLLLASYLGSVSLALGSAPASAWDPLFHSVSPMGWKYQRFPVLCETAKDWLGFFRFGRRWLIVVAYREPTDSC